MSLWGCRLLALCFAVEIARGAVPSAVAIRDARIVTVSGAELAKGTVVLKDGLISDVGASVSIPLDAYVIDGQGLTVYPGFIDGLSTWGIPQLASPPGRQTAQPAAPAPRAKGPEDRPQTFAYRRAADLVKSGDKRLAAARAAGFTSAATFPGDGIFHGQGALINLADEDDSQMVVLSPVAQQITFRTAGFRAGFPNSLMGVISYIRQVYLDLDQYKQAKDIYTGHASGLRRPAYDHNLEGLIESPRILLPAVEAQQIDRALPFGAELKQSFVLYGLHEGYERLDDLKQAHVPLLISLKWPEKPKDADPAIVPSYRELTMRDRAPGVPGLLAKADVHFGFYSDGVSSAAEFKKAVKKAIDAGLPQADAIRALTLGVAETYGAADRLGTIDKGKIANLTITKGDAFADKSTVEYVFVDGREFKPTAEEQQPAPGGNGPAGPGEEN